MGFVRSPASFEPPAQASDVADIAPDGDIPILLCADDYAMTAGISEAIRLLAASRRISAVSCVVVSPHWMAEAARLKPVAATLDVGLHFTLTHTTPAVVLPTLAPAHRLPSPLQLFSRAFSGQVDVSEVMAELRAQLALFAVAFGRMPDFIDSHYHCHLLPGVREAVLRVLIEDFPIGRPWLRFLTLSSADILTHYRLAVPAAAFLALLGCGHHRLGMRHGVCGNTHFRGVRRFFGDPPYRQLFRRFCRGVRSGTLIMCHPGLDDGEVLPTQHPIAAREDELAFLASDEMTHLLAAQRLRVERFRALQPPALQPPAPTFKPVVAAPQR